MSTSTATAYNYSVAGHLSFGAPKFEKAQKSSGFWANRTYRHCIKDNVLIDPACGSGNFLTETYLSLRNLENAIRSNLLVRTKGEHNRKEYTVGEQMEMGGVRSEEFGDRVTLNQFYGIEINDFAVAVAETALWISRLKANREAMLLYDLDIDPFPLEEAAHIVLGNALRMDWNGVVPAEECDFIMGNPPFVGHQWRSKEQQMDMQSVFEGWNKFGKLDYVCAWYAKASSFISNTSIHTAFVSTNSICQGESVQILWEQLSMRNIIINFAWPSFKWTNEASNQAGVTVVIVGFSYNEMKSQKKLFYSNETKEVSNINGYLVDGDNIYIQSRGKPLNYNCPEMTKGSQPTDGGGLILDSKSKKSLLVSFPELEEVIRPYMGGDEFIKGKKRWCLWFEGVDIERYSHIQPLTERLDYVRSKRLASPTASVRKDAATPWLFTQRRQPKKVYMVIPEVSSENREYIPVGLVEPYIIASNQLRYVPTNSLFILGLALSKAHMAWMRIVSGRLESRYRYSPAVWNSFIWPNPTDAQKAKIESCAQAVLDVRDNHPGASLATLYDPDKMPADLLAAHRALDMAVEEAYGVDFNGDEEKIVAHLFKLYQKKVEELDKPKEKKKAPAAPEPKKVVVKVRKK